MDAHQAFTEDLTAAAAERGIVLTPEMAQQVFQESLANGFNPDATRAALDSYEPFEAPEVDDDVTTSPGEARLAHDFNVDAGALQSKLGRKLTHREAEQLSDAAVQQAARHDSIDLNAAATEHGIRPWSEMSSREQAQVMAEQCRDRDPEPEPDPDREFDLSNHRDFDDWAALRVAGYEPEDDG